MTGTRGAAVVALAAALALPIAGCGKDKPKIPRSDAQALIALLRQADARAAAKSCTGLENRTLPELEARVSSLPANTDLDIRTTLRDGIDNLRNLIAVQCSTVKPKPKQSTTTTDTTTQAPTTTQTQTQTQPPTQTSPPTTNTTPPTTTTPPTGPTGGSPSGKGKAKGKKK
jgi:hypothetical protein